MGTQNYLLLSNSKEILAKNEILNIVEILYISKLGKPTNYELLNPDGWIFLARELKKDFPEMKLIELNAIILAGIKGKLTNYQQLPINPMTIYKWIDVWNTEWHTSWKSHNE